jgi:hypothetical protein
MYITLAGDEVSFYVSSHLLVSIYGDCALGAWDFHAQVHHVYYLKGKCAFGPFLSILVIECKHKCLM